MKKDTTLKIRMKDIESQKNEIIRLLRNGGIGVMPTDTIYGLVGQALKSKTIEKIYRVRKRNPSKPLIILISSFDDLNLFNIRQAEKMKSKLKEFWPGKVSVIMPCLDERLSYLHRGTNSLAFRMPDHVLLQNIISKVGPLAAPSANLEGMSPATTIEEAEKYFGDSVDFYLDGGKIQSPPSKLIKMERENIVELRK